MVRLDHTLTFVPAIEETFGKENVIIVKNASGGQPIRRWYKDWKDPSGIAPESTGDLYDRLMEDVNAAIEGEKFASVTFIWMQGEKDARNSWGEVYASSLQGLIDQLSDDLGRKKINVVIGRISDSGFRSDEYPHWSLVREAQEEVAASNRRYVWVDTDDLNDGINKEGKEIDVSLRIPIVALKKDNLGIARNINGHWRLIGWGKIL